MYYNISDIYFQYSAVRFLSDFICPFCKNSLIKEEKQFICPLGHSFDIAKEGYIHLLPVNKMHSKIPGDTKEMVLSRRRFLQSGYYDIFSDKLNEIVISYASDNMRILDAGCGEGFYTHRLKESLSDYKNTSVSAFDISKTAVKYASKHDKDISFAVASVFDIPVSDNSIDILVNIFAPFADSEFLRVLKKGGYLIYAVPSSDHLYGLKAITYESPYYNEVRNTEYDGFEEIRRIPVRDNIVIDNNKLIVDLFTMTPYYFKTSEAGRQKIRACQCLKTPIGFDFLIYRKK